MLEFEFTDLACILTMAVADRRRGKAWLPTNQIFTGEEQCCRPMCSSELGSWQQHLHPLCRSAISPSPRVQPAKACPLPAYQTLHSPSIHNPQCAVQEMATNMPQNHTNQNEIGAGSAPKFKLPTEHRLPCCSTPFISLSGNWAHCRQDSVQYY